MAKSQKFVQQMAALEEGETFQVRVLEKHAAGSSGTEGEETGYAVYLRAGTYNGRPWCNITARHEEKAKDRLQGGWLKGFGGRGQVMSFSLANPNMLQAFLELIHKAEAAGLFEAVQKHVAWPEKKKGKRTKKVAEATL